MPVFFMIVCVHPFLSDSLFRSFGNLRIFKSMNRIKGLWCGHLSKHKGIRDGMGMYSSFSFCF
jgi:hypothetical protein